MTILSTNYRIEPGEYGAAIITVSGRCTTDASQVAAIVASCVRHYALVKIPHTNGVVLKSLDGSTPVLSSVTPSTIGKSYTCVKVEGCVNPLAPTQPGGTYQGYKIGTYMMRYVEIGGVA